MANPAAVGFNSLSSLNGIGGLFLTNSMSNSKQAQFIQPHLVATGGADLISATSTAVNNKSLKSGNNVFSWVNDPNSAAAAAVSHFDGNSLTRFFSFIFENFIT